MRRWLLGTVAICLALIGVEIAVWAATAAVMTRDVGWVPGPFAAVQDFIFDWSWSIALLVLLLAEIPALWWRRIGGGASGVLGIAFICPVVIFAPGLIPKGYSEDALVLFGGSLFIFVVAAIASTLIMLFVRPVADLER